MNEKVSHSIQPAAPGYRDLVEVTMPDGSVRQGVVQATYAEGGLFIFHPEFGNMFWGAQKGGLKSKGVSVRTIGDELANFRLDLYRPAPHPTESSTG